MQVTSPIFFVIFLIFLPLYHAREIAAIKLSSGCSCKAKSARSSNISYLFLVKQFIPLALVGYEMVIAQRGAYLSSHIQRTLVE